MGFLIRGWKEGGLCWAVTLHSHLLPSSTQLLRSTSGCCTLDSHAGVTFTASDYHAMQRPFISMIYKNYSCFDWFCSCMELFYELLRMKKNSGTAAGCGAVSAAFWDVYWCNKRKSEWLMVVGSGVVWYFIADSIGVIKRKPLSLRVSSLIMLYCGNKACVCDPWTLASHSTQHKALGIYILVNFISPPLNAFAMNPKVSSVWCQDVSGVMCDEMLAT